MSKKVPRGLGFGAAPLGNAQPAISQKDALAALESAHANGIRYFDTAPLYGRGRSESFIGEFLASESRNDLVLSTKAGRLLRGGGFIYDYSFDGVMRSIDESLERLRVEYLDLVYMHDIGEQTHGNDHRRVMTEAIDGGFKALARLKDEGVIGALGIGVNETAVCMEALAAVDLDYVMLAGRYTLLDRSAEQDVLPALKRHGAKLVSAAPFNSGILVKGAVPGARFDYQVASSETMRRVRDIEHVCDEFGVPLAAAALQFPLRHADVDCVVTGMRTVSQVEASSDWLRTPIPEAFWVALDSAR